MKQMFVWSVLFFLSLSFFVWKTFETDYNIDKQQKPVHSFHLIESQINSQTSSTDHFFDDSKNESDRFAEKQSSYSDHSENQPRQCADRLVALTSPIKDFLGIQTENRLLRMNSSTSFASNRLLLASVSRNSQEMGALFSSIPQFRQPFDSSSIACPLFLILLTLRN